MIPEAEIIRLAILCGILFVVGLFFLRRIKMKQRDVTHLRYRIDERPEGYVLQIWNPVRGKFKWVDTATAPFRQPGRAHALCAKLNAPFQKHKAQGRG